MPNEHLDEAEFIAYEFQSEFLRLVEASPALQDRIKALKREFPQTKANFKGQALKISLATVYQACCNSSPTSLHTIYTRRNES